MDGKVYLTEGRVHKALDELSSLSCALVALSSINLNTSAVVVEILLVTAIYSYMIDSLFLLA